MQKANGNYTFCLEMNFPEEKVDDILSRLNPESSDFKNMLAAEICRLYLRSFSVSEAA